MTELLKEFPQAKISFLNSSDRSADASISGIVIEFTYLDGTTKEENATNLKVLSGEEHIISSQPKCVRAIGLVSVAVKVGDVTEILQTRGRSASEGKCTARDQFVISATSEVSDAILEDGGTIFDLFELKQAGTDTGNPGKVNSRSV